MSDKTPSLSDLRIIRTLVRQPGWLEDVGPQVRKGMVARLLQLMQKPDARSRELIGVAKVIVAMEKNDFERCRQLARFEFEEEEGDEDEGSR